MVLFYRAWEKSRHFSIEYNVENKKTVFCCVYKLNESYQVSKPSEDIVKTRYKINMLLHGGSTKLVVKKIDTFRWSNVYIVINYYKWSVSFAEFSLVVWKVNLLRCRFKKLDKSILRKLCSMHKMRRNRKLSKFFNLQQKCIFSK